MTLFTFLLFLAVFLGVGLYSARRRKPTSEDYLLASRQVGPVLVGLSMAATLHSGFMFTGLIGFAYKNGVSTCWFSIGQILGQIVIWSFLFRRFRDYAGRIEAHTFTQCLTQNQKSGAHLIRIVSSAIILVFLGITAGGQLLAGGKALNVVLGWQFSVGAIAAFFVIIAYCLAGGIRASIWTDGVQAVVMVGSLLLLACVGVHQIGGIDGLSAGLKAQDPQLVSLVPPPHRFGNLLYFLGWVALGLSWVGQPHFMVRMMALRDSSGTSRSMTVYFMTMVALQATAIVVGLVCRVVYPAESTSFDPETSGLMLARDLLPAALLGIILAGLFAAIVSTADSLVLACSAALTHDLFPRLGKSYALTKLGTVASAVGALVIALFSSDNVFSLVLLGVAAIGSGFGPLVVARILGLALSTTVANIALLAGPAAVLIWKYQLGFGSEIHEVFAGLLTGSLVIVAGVVAGKREVEQASD